MHTSAAPAGWILQPYIQPLNDCEYRVAVVGSGVVTQAFPVCTTFGADGKPCIQRMPNQYDWYEPAKASGSRVTFSHVHNAGMRSELIEVAKAVRGAMAAAMCGSLPTIGNVFLRVDICHAIAYSGDPDESSEYVWLINECDNAMIQGDILSDMSVDDCYRMQYARSLAAFINDVQKEHFGAMGHAVGPRLTLGGRRGGRHAAGTRGGGTVPGNR